MDGPSDSDLEGITVGQGGVSYEVAQADATAMERRLKELSVQPSRAMKAGGILTASGAIVPPLGRRATPLSVQAAPPGPEPRRGRGGRGEFRGGGPGRARRNRRSREIVTLPAPLEVGTEDLEDLTVQSQALSDALADQGEEIQVLQEEILVLKQSQNNLLSMITVMQRRIDELTPDQVATLTVDTVKPSVVVAPKKAGITLPPSQGLTQSPRHAADDWLNNLDF